MPVASKVMPGSLAESSFFLMRSSARSRAPCRRLTLIPSLSLDALMKSRIRSTSAPRYSLWASALMGIRSNADRDMMTASQSPVAQRATNWRRRLAWRSSRWVTRTFAWG